MMSFDVVLTDHGAVADLTPAQEKEFEESVREFEVITKEGKDLLSCFNVKASQIIRDLNKDNCFSVLSNTRTLKMEIGTENMTLCNDRLEVRQYFTGSLKRSMLDAIDDRLELNYELIGLLEKVQNAAEKIWDTVLYG